MNKVHVLDCTLRDGGYCNQWEFGYNNIKKIVDSLVHTGIDIIECGFLTNRVSYEPDKTKYASVEDIKGIFPQERDGKMFAAMINYGEYKIEDLPDYDGSSIDSIRVAFHKKNLKDALKFCGQISDKGYKVFVQAMVSVNYADEEFLDMIRQVNELKPYAFYVVDSFGMMKKKDLMRFFYMVEHNLDEDIWVGFHSHNNMQLAYSNAQSLVEIQTNRNLIIDTSIHGMGRGAGNLNTELFVEYLNDVINTNYELKPLLNVIDEVLKDIYHQNNWGYSLPNYLSARYNMHPNYAGYLNDKNMLTLEAMDDIFSMMKAEKRVEFDKEYIEELYTNYMNRGRVQEEHRSELRNRMCNKQVLLIAPGKSSVEEKEKILAYADQNDVFSISINHDYSYMKTDVVFVSNLRRFRELDISTHERCIITSNINSDGIYLQTKYYDLLNEQEAVRDKAGIMAIRFVIGLGVKKVVLAGFDGYSHDMLENYANQQMMFSAKNRLLDSINNGMKNAIIQFRKEADIEFLTSPRYF